MNFIVSYNRLVIIISIQVSYYSKRYRSLHEAEEVDFASCSKCLRFIDAEDEEVCIGCDSEEARRLCGKWTLTKMLTQERRSRLSFKQGEKSLCYVLFHTEENPDKFKENCDYELQGWQKTSSRHNTIRFI